MDAPTADVTLLQPDHPALTARLLELQRAAYALEARLIGFDGIPPLHEDRAALLARRLTWLGAWVGDDLVGALGYTVVELGEIDIDRLVVDPAWHRRGIGRVLLDALPPHLRATVTTGTANTPAVALYTSAGFVAGNRRTIAPGVTVTEFVRTA